MLRNNSRNDFELGYIFENFNQKGGKNMIFCQKSLFWHFFVKNFQKYCLIKKFKKKTTFLEKCLNVIFKQF